MARKSYAKCQFCGKRYETFPNKEEHVHKEYQEIENQPKQHPLLRKSGN